MTVVALGGARRRYDWGSTTAIQHLLGEAPDGRPLAELWYGAHPDDASWVPAAGRGLDALIAEDPQRLLGADVYQRFGPRLPYLLKVLAADRALSIQVHPDLDQARAGFAAENAAGVPRDAPQRNYRDANHKPELLCALTPFEALCGFRPVADTLEVIDDLALPELAFLTDRLRGPDPLRDAFTAVLTHPDPRGLAAVVARRAAELGRRDRTGQVLRLVANDFPGDVGIVLALLLNHVRLAPGEAIYLGAGNVHCYLRGTGVEAMAASDNVLRCALTTKHVDVRELVRVTDFRELADSHCPVDAGRYAVPVPDFALTAVDVAGEWRPAAGRPQLVLCADGTFDAGGIPLAPGRAVFVGADEPAPALRGRGRAFVVAPGT